MAKPKAMSRIKLALLVAGACVYVAIVAAATISNNRTRAWDRLFSAKATSTAVKEDPVVASEDQVTRAKPDEPSVATKIEFQIASKTKLEEMLRDPKSAQFSDVHAHLISKGNEEPNFVFCGTVNAKNGFGGYSGRQRFVANPLIAIVENGTSDFEKIWAMSCLSANDKGWVWF